MAFHNPFLKDGRIVFPDNGSVVKHVEKWAKVVKDAGAEVVCAAEYALAFVTRYLTGRETAGDIAHALSRHFADTCHNPLGFAYALHSGMDSRLERTA